MERAVAITRLRKIFGKQFAYEINPKAASDEERAAAQAAQPAIQAESRAAGEALEARKRQLLDNDPEFQQLLERCARARKAREDNYGILMVHKITVGTVNGMFFRVAAQANSWEQIFEILKKERKEVI